MVLTVKTKPKLLQASRSTVCFLDAWKQKDINFVHRCLAAVDVSQLLFNPQLLSSSDSGSRAWLHYLGPREPIQKMGAFSLSWSRRRAKKITEHFVQHCSSWKQEHGMTADFFAHPWRAPR